MLQVEAGETVGGGFRGGLLQNEPHSMGFAEVIDYFPQMADDLEAVGQGLVGFVKLAAFPDLDEFVQPRHPDEIGGIGHPEIGGAVALHGEHGQGSGVPEGEESVR